MKTLMTLAFALFASTAVAEGTHSHGDMEMSMGTITKVDTQWNRLTIDHGPLENLDMEAMTMVFEVVDPAMLEGLSEGQEVAFTADRVKGKLTVTEITVE
ncbi:MAG: RND transporter [Pseudooceanicola sp.]|nr:RND transporter [Pseudooceanicola sp.]|tara:strand:+ start:5162 stop:5461 length:300 start_codon:yes stop_codon:yes gene_type:complete